MISKRISIAILPWLLLCGILAQACDHSRNFVCSESTKFLLDDSLEEDADGAEQFIARYSASVADESGLLDIESLLGDIRVLLEMGVRGTVWALPPPRV